MDNQKKTKYIKQCIDTYKQQFEEDWIEKYDWTTLETAKQSKSEIQKRIVEFVRTCFVCVSSSILQGEYIINRDLFERTKNSFSRYWDKEHYCPNKDDENYEIFKHREFAYRLHETLDEHLSSLFDTYTSFIAIVDEKLDFGKHIYLFKAKTKEPRLIKDFHYFTILRDLIIPLCEIEHRLEFSEDVRRKVSFFVESLNIALSEEVNNNCRSVIELARDKATFILRKLLRPGDSFEVLINCDKKVISRDKLLLSDSSFIDLFSCYENIHENIQYDESNMNDCLQRVYNRSGLFLDYALIMDYYCTTNKSLEQINNVLSKFDERYNKKHKREYKYNFDNHSLCTLRNFMYNCRLAFLTKQNGYTIDKLKSDMNQIEMVHSETFVSNFYPYKKAIEFLIKKIQDEIEKRNLEFDYDNNIVLLEKYLQKFDENLEWCEVHKFYPIQLPFKECIVNTINGDVLLPSTVTRPIDYIKLREVQQNFHQCYENFKMSLIYLKDKKDIQSVKDEIKVIEKRYLELGSILVGIVTFLFGTINIFTQPTSSVTEMFRSILGLGTVLVIFASLMIIVIENYWNTSTNKLRVSLCSIIILIYTALIIWLAVNPSL